jgi:hypothetical protein
MRRGLAPLVIGIALSGCGLFDLFEKEPEREPIPFYSITVEDGRTLAGTADGRIFATNDGDTWAQVMHLSSWPIWSVYRDANMELGVGGPYFATNWSTFGWTGWDTQYPIELAGVGACLGAGWVAGSGGYAARTVDGTNWLPVSGIPASAHMVDLACGPSFVLLASYAQTSGYWTSVDGTSVTNVTSPADTCSVAHGNGSFYALATDGRVFASPDDDANTWTEVGDMAWNELVPYCTIQYAADTFCLMGEETITCCDAGWASCTEIEIPVEAQCPIYDFDFQEDGVLWAVGPDGCLVKTQCSNGTCEPPEITTATYDPELLYPPPVFGGSGSGGGDGDGDTGTCDPCTTDADCIGVAERNGVAGAACGDDGLCYACFSICDGNGANCSCITCAEGCGGDAVCTGGNLCTFEIDGKLPCE